MTTRQPPRSVETFRSTFTGEVVVPGDPTYDERRAVWNGTVDRHPQVIAVCRSIDDIVSGVRASREAGESPAIRAGGHSVAGLSMCDGVVLDLSAMRHVRVDPDGLRAHAEPGATWHDLDAACAEHGLATTGGLISSTGVAGLTLGGGIGWLQRRYGLACDNLVAADMVTATGELVHASPDENPDLLWGLRGGAGNLGVVAGLELALHPVSTVLGGMLLFSFERAAEVLRAFRGWCRTAPDESSFLAAVITAPPEPFVPEEYTGQKVLAILGCWCGDLEAGAAAIAPLRDAAPIVDLFGPMPYVGLQSMLDAGAPYGARNYFRSGYTDDLTDAMIDILVEHGSRMPSPMSQIHVHQMGGAVSRVPADATAYSGREAAFTYNLVSTWLDPAEDGMYVEANRLLATALAPLALPGSYVNFLSDENEAQVRDAYGPSYGPMPDLKRAWDPENLFRRNQNVSPA